MDPPGKKPTGIVASGPLAVQFTFSRLSWNLPRDVSNALLLTLQRGNTSGQT